jgi:ubiquinone/menaquinone biosynthesis C-methylase UbiE
MAGVHSRARSFDAAARACEIGRPGWPREAVEIVARRLGLQRHAAVLDLAAGTGKLTRLLAGRFASVTAVEPLPGMRAVLEVEVPGALALAGTAEAIPLADASVDAVFVAEAFHWFDPAGAVAELARVLRPGGGVAVLYNQLDWQDASSPWRAEANHVFHRHRLPADEIDPYDQKPWRAALSAIGELSDDAVEGNVQRLDPAGVEAMYASFSGLAGLPPDRRDLALAEIRGVLERHRVREVELGYRTEITTARG